MKEKPSGKFVSVDPPNVRNKSTGQVGWIATKRVEGGKEWLILVDEGKRVNPFRCWDITDIEEI